MKTNLGILCRFPNYLLPSLFLQSICVELGFGPDQHLVATDLRDQPTLIQETHKYAQDKLQRQGYISTEECNMWQ